ncbi:hypothetical protein [Enterococcus caccae]|uniref:Uncharacterized protein n=1 Tax=Enterococcus caccae ATCC BAA-1240 TaxID=1158612 RepID=R3TXD3_9ENTE|nr:hypothetical protein [Enterococcus caccae]EOL45793.1 hypothetical protein UC7_01590 [Enterococcus caccae ATCC BAA-1240]EOT60989.1 hypothetical protein I580_01891 [Enterococcus caccae ATCC BAA-1240]
MAKYRCIDNFSVPFLEDFEGNEVEGKELSVEKDSIWEGVIIHGDSEVFLQQENGNWLDISSELFELMFEREELQ